MNEKAVSKQQQKFFGIVRGLQTGKIKDASPDAKKAAASMSKKDVKDFAATKHKGLPKKKVDELDTKTLRRYADRAGKQADTLGTKDQHPKANKRADGEKRAAKKIAQRMNTEGKASSSKHKRVLAVIGSAKNLDQAVKMVMKSHNADEKKAKSLVHRAIKSTFYGESYGDTLEACWSGYKQVGMKKKGDKMVPD